MNDCTFKVGLKFFFKFPEKRLLRSPLSIEIVDTILCTINGVKGTLNLILEKNCLFVPLTVPVTAKDNFYLKWFQLILKGNVDKYLIKKNQPRPQRIFSLKEEFFR